MFKKVLFWLIAGIVCSPVLWVTMADYTGTLTKTVVGAFSQWGQEFANYQDTVVYTIAYTNSGTLPVDVNFSDPIPNGLSIIPPIFGLGWPLISGCVGFAAPQSMFVNSSTIYYNGCKVNPSTTVTITVIWLVQSSNYLSIPNTVTATIFSGGSQIDTHTSLVTFYPYPKLSITKTFTGNAPQWVGSPARFEITIANSGSIAAQDILLSDPFPQWFTFSSISPNRSNQTNNTLQTQYNGKITIPANTTVTYLVTLLTNNNFLPGTILINTGMIATGTNSLTGTIIQNATATASFVIAGNPFVTLTKTILSPTNGKLYQSWDLITYQITLTNTGNWAARGLLSDLMPSQITALSSSLAPTTTGSIRTRNNILIKSGYTVNFLLTGVLNANYPAGTIFVNNADFVLQSPSSGTVVDLGTATGIVLWTPNLVINKTQISPVPQVQGDKVAYQITITNSGTAAASWWCVADIFPSSLNAFASSVATGGCSLLWVTSPYIISGNAFPSLTNGILPVGSSVSFVVTWSLVNTYAPGYMFTNTGIVWFVSPSQTELSLSDNTSFSTTAVAGIANLVFDKKEINSRTMISWAAGTITTFVLTVQNNGTVPYTGLQVIDNLPSPFVYSGTLEWPLLASSTPYISGTHLVWNRSGALQPWTSGKIVFSAYFPTTLLTGTFTNTSSLTGLTKFVQSNESSEFSNWTMSIIPSADIQITKTILTPVSWISWSVVSFQINVVNNGVITTNVVIHDLFPSLFRFSSYLTNIPGLTVFDFASKFGGLESNSFALNPGQSWYLIVTGYLNSQPLTSFSYANTAYVTGMLTDADNTNNSATVTGSASVTIGCSLTKTASNNPWLLKNTDLSGKLVSYTLNLTNNGTIDMTNVTLTDLWPSNELTTPSVLTRSGFRLTPGQSTGFVVSGTLFDRTIVSLENTARASFVVNGTTFSCTGSSDIPRSAPSCNNGYLEWNEECDTYGGATVFLDPITRISATILGNSFSILSYTGNTYSCNASCKIQAIAVQNCVTMTVPWLSPQTPCVSTLWWQNKPLLTIKKFVNGNDANIAPGHILTWNTLNYTIVIQNIGSGDAFNVLFSDPLPSLLTNLTSISASNGATVTNTNGVLNANLGSLVPGSSVTVSFTATVSSSFTSWSFTNTGFNTSYTDLLGTLLSWASDPAIVSTGITPPPPSSTCRDGIIQSGESCDLGSGDPLIGDYLSIQNYQQNPSFGVNFNHRNKRCVSCQIDNSFNPCGDGKIGMLEMCDMWLLSGQTAVSITDRLNTSGTIIDAGIYKNAWYSCTSACELIKSGVVAQQPACRYNDTVISVMSGEVLPVAIDIEIPNSWQTVNSSNDCGTKSSDGKIIRDSLQCTIKIFNKDEETTNPQWASFSKVYDCELKERSHTSSLFSSFKNDEFFVQNPYGTFLIDVGGPNTNTSNGLVLKWFDGKDSYGEYKLSLDRVDYNYCKGGTSVPGNHYARVCQINIAVTKPYLMQKSNITYKPSTDISDFWTIGADFKTLISTTQFNNISEQINLNTLDYKGKVKTLTNDLVEKYKKLAVLVGSSSVLEGLKKVPGKSIYIVKSTLGNTLVLDANKFSDTSNSTTFIMEGNGNLQIEWSMNSNMLIIVPDWSVSFKPRSLDSFSSDKYSSEKNRCDTQIIRGIIIANEFKAISNTNVKNTKSRISNNTNSSTWCRKGNLHIYGALYGDRIQDIVNSRRSHLEHRFTFRKDFDGIAPTMTQINAERRDEIYKWASVYIEQNPSLWKDMPPGADSFLKTLNISRN